MILGDRRIAWPHRNYSFQTCDKNFDARIRIARRDRIITEVLQDHKAMLTCRLGGCCFLIDVGHKEYLRWIINPQGLRDLNIAECLSLVPAQRKREEAS